MRSSRRRPSAAAPAPSPAADPALLLSLASLRAGQSYAALAELVRRHGGEGGPGGLELTPYELRVFSQNGEDGVIAELVRRAGATNRFFVEFGVGPGAEGNCVALADVLGWSGLFMESQPDAHAALARRHRANPRVRTREAHVTPHTIDLLLREEHVPSEPDVLSIDVDGPDYWIWEAMEAFRPRIVIVEYNSALDPTRRLVQPFEAGAWDGTDYVGASLGAFEALAERKGYRLAHTDLAGVNAFFVRGDLEVELPPQEGVPRRAPNLLLGGHGLPADPHGREYVDLD